MVLSKGCLSEEWSLIKGSTVLASQDSSRVVLSEAVDGCICFTRKIQHGGDWERSRPQGPKNVHNFLMTVRPLSWACGHGTEMLLILKKNYFDLIMPRYFPLWQSKEMSRDFVRGQSVAETCFSHWDYQDRWFYTKVKVKRVVVNKSYFEVPLRPFSACFCSSDFPSRNFITEWIGNK